MVGVVATLEIKEDRQAEFEAVMRDLAARVRAEESGCRHYQLCRSKKPGIYLVMESYQDMEAFRAHSQTDYFKAAAARMAACFAGAPKIEVLEEIG